MKIIHDTLLMNLPNAILAINEHNVIRFANTAFGKLTGRRAEDFLNKPLSETFQHLGPTWETLAGEFSQPLREPGKNNLPDNRKNNGSDNYHRDPLLGCADADLDFDPPSVITLKDQIFTYQFFDAGKTSEGNQLRGLILNDLTEEKGFLDRMTQAEYISSLKTLVAGISHEIGNPIHSILSFAEAIKDENDWMKIKQYAEKIAGNSSRLGKILGDFSGYVVSKEKGGSKEIDINECIKSALKFAMLPYEENKIAVEEDLKELPKIMADPNDLQQVFFNVINNACQAMKQNGLLRISTAHENDILRIVIKDNGSGIPKEILRKVFNPFFTTKMQGQGTGLGLNIVQRLVEKYKGRIEIQSREGEGTEVSLLFPTLSSS